MEKFYNYLYSEKDAPYRAMKMEQNDRPSSASTSLVKVESTSSSTKSPSHASPQDEYPSSSAYNQEYSASSYSSSYLHEPSSFYEQEPPPNREVEEDERDRLCLHAEFMAPYRQATRSQLEEEQKIRARLYEEIDGYRADLAVCRREFHDCRAELATAKLEIAFCQENLAAKQQELTDKDAHPTETQKELASTQEELLTEAQRGLAESQEETAMVKEELKRYQDYLALSQQECRKKLEASQQEVLKSQRDLASSQQQLAACRRQLLELQQRFVVVLSSSTREHQKSSNSNTVLVATSQQTTSLNAQAALAEKGELTPSLVVELKRDMEEKIKEQVDNRLAACLRDWQMQDQVQRQDQAGKRQEQSRDNVHIGRLQEGEGTAKEQTTTTDESPSGHKVEQAERRTAANEISQSSTSLDGKEMCLVDEDLPATKKRKLDKADVKLRVVKQEIRDDEKENDVAPGDNVEVAAPSSTTWGNEESHPTSTTQTVDMNEQKNNQSLPAISSVVKKEPESNNPANVASRSSTTCTTTRDLKLKALIEKKFGVRELFAQAPLLEQGASLEEILKRLEDQRKDEKKAQASILREAGAGSGSEVEVRGPTSAKNIEFPPLAGCSFQVSASSSSQASASCTTALLLTKSDRIFAPTSKRHPESH
ncbi:unnamed protein product [Amoebophrya sp. A25]|nr:unnamed protein product [Amoebophrya sp. A25]|eukprot:GSA25T00003070001.1